MFFVGLNKLFSNKKHENRIRHIFPFVKFKNPLLKVSGGDLKKCNSSSHLWKFLTHPSCLSVWQPYFKIPPHKIFQISAFSTRLNVHHYIELIRLPKEFYQYELWNLLKYLSFVILLHLLPTSWRYFAAYSLHPS